MHGTMTKAATDDGSAVLGVALMSIAMLAVPLVDGIAKVLSASHSPLFIAWARYAAACLFALPWAIARFGWRDFLPREELPAHALRTVFATAAMTAFFSGLAYAPMADVTSAYFVGPIIAMVLAVLLLGERLTPRKSGAVALGFAGALIVVDPAGAINPGLPLGIVAGLFFAAYLIASRMASRGSDPVKTLAFQCLFGALLMLPQALWTWSIPAVDAAPLLLALGAVSVFCHFLTIAAFRHAQASLLAPLSYLELVGAVAVGYAAFGDLPALRVWAGAAAIVAGGALLLSRKPLSGTD
jgi:drug/metabolite transporter (DMT)-like permease